MNQPGKPKSYPLAGRFLAMYSFAVKISYNKAMSGMRNTDPANQNNRDTRSDCINKTFDQVEADSYDRHQGCDIQPGNLIVRLLQCAPECQILHQLLRKGQNNESIQGIIKKRIRFFYTGQADNNLKDCRKEQNRHYAKHTPFQRSAAKFFIIFFIFNTVLKEEVKGNGRN